MLDSQMNWRRVGILLAAASCIAFAVEAAEIRGRVTDPAGAGIASALVSAQPNGGSSGHTATTEPDGNYSLGDLPPGAYTLRARKPGYADGTQGPIQVLDNAAVVVNFRLTPLRASEELRGAEERNPNDFIIRLDTNAIQNELARTGTTLRFVSEFRLDRSYYGEQLGHPLRTVELASPGRPLLGFHGSVSEQHQSSPFNARPFFQVGPLLPSRRNQYGFSVSGPIRREKAWFSFAWGQVRDSGFVNGNVQVPRPQERTPRSSDPQMNAAIAALLRAYPDEPPNLPHVSIRHLNTNALRDIRSTAFSLNLDYRPRPGHSLTYEQQFSDYAEEPFELVLGQNPETFLRPQRIGLTYSYTLSPNTVGQVALSYRRLGALLLLTPRFQNLLASVGFSDPPDMDVGDEITSLGLPGQGIPRKRFENHYLLSPQISHSRGRHTLAAGFSVEQLRDSDLRSSNARGRISFENDFENSAIENFLRGRSSRLALTVGNQYRGYRNSEYVFYFQDRFRLRESLLLSWGMRYEILAVPREVNHLFRFVHRTDANNFAPQFGFAWNPGLGKTAVRGGYGIAFGTITLATFNRQAANPPHVLSLSTDAPDLLTALRDVATLEPDAGKRSNLNQVDPDLVMPYSHIYNLAVEREMPGNTSLRVAYLGSRTLKMFIGVALNRAVPVEGIPLTSETVNRRRPNPQILKIFNIVNTSRGYLDALQISVSKRRFRGLTFEARYTFSKAIDTGISNFADTGNGGDVSQSEELVSDVKSVSTFDTPHALSVNYSYELPALGNGLLSRLLGRWVISGTTTLRSGTPFAVYTGSDAPGFGNVDGESNDRPNLLNPSILGASADNPDASTSVLRPEYFDTNIAPGGRGNIGYRVFRKDGTNNWNVALAKSFSLGGQGSERQMQFRTEFYNFFNHAHFAAPGNTVSSPTFGQITNTVNKGRVVQLTLRLVF